MDYESYDWPYFWEERDEDRRVYIEYVEWLASQSLPEDEDSLG